MSSKNENSNNDSLETIRIEDVYGIIHHVQTSQSGCSFVSHPIDAITIENILRDSKLLFEKDIDVRGVKFKLSPCPTEADAGDKYIFDEDLEDEMPEDGQCF